MGFTKNALFPNTQKQFGEKQIPFLANQFKICFSPLQEKSLLLIVFHYQGKVYMSRYVTIYICHLCQCQEKFKAILTFTYVTLTSTYVTLTSTYVKVVSISTNDRIFVSMTYVNVSFTFVKVGFNICQDFFILCQC